MSRILGVLALALVMGAAGCESSAGPAAVAESEDRGNGLSSIDQPFVRDVSAEAVYAIKASELALNTSCDEKVCLTAQQVIDEQKQTHAQLARIANDKGESAETSPTFDQLELLDRLSKLEGAEFDKEYIRQMAQLHREQIDELQSEAMYGTDAEMRRFCTSSLPKTQEELHAMTGETSPALGSER